MSDPGNNSHIHKLDKIDAKTFLEAEGISIDQLRNDIKLVEWRDVLDKSARKLRKSCWYTKHPCTCKYSYGNSCWEACSMPKWMSVLADALSKLCELNESEEFFDGVNCNLYDDSSKALPWHSDNEHLFKKKDGTATIISISFGAARSFDWRKKLNKSEGGMTTLEDLDILTMTGKTQLFYEHSVPAMGVYDALEESNPRINLTFRFIANHDPKCPVVAN